MVIMGIKAVIDTLFGFVGGAPSDGMEPAMDIVDRNGRHHEPKGVPPGGQFESEGQYATTAKAKSELYHKKFASTDKASQMRDFCAGILSHIDGSEIGNDTAKSDYKKQVHAYADMTKQSVLDGASRAYDDMKKHARTYESVKDMSKEDFTKWVSEHKEYDSMQMQNLLANKAYNKKYKIKDANGFLVEQDHEAWEEAKMMVARKATASMIDYMAHVEALNNTPDALIDKFLEGKGASEQHKGGYEDYEKNYSVKHGDADNKNVTMSEIQALESELSKAFADAKNDESKTPYAHALSHFLGKDGGLRDPKATKHDVMKKIAGRLLDKGKALNAAQESGNTKEYLKAYDDFDATQNAAMLSIKAMGVDKNELIEMLDGMKGGKAEVPADVGSNVPSTTIVSNGNSGPKAVEPPKQEGQPTVESEPKKSLTEKGKKLHGQIESFVKSPFGLNVMGLAEKTPQNVKDGVDKQLDGKNIEAMLAEANKNLNIAKAKKAEGNKGDALNNLGIYGYIVGKVYNILSSNNIGE
jgi:hypothetical protein